MSSLRKKPNSPFWYIQFKSNGGWKQKSTQLRWSDPKENAQAFLLKKKMDAAEAEISFKNDHRTDWSYVDQFLADRMTNPKTLKRYRATWERVFQWLTENKIFGPDKVVYKNVPDYLHWRTNQTRKNGKHISRNTALYDIKVFGVVQQQAVRLGLATSNPVLRHGIKKANSPKKPAITDDEMARIQEALKDEPQWMQDSFAIALHTGCRLRETIIPLKCVDMTAKTITFPSPKGGEIKSFTIPMPDALEPVFARMKREGRKVTLEMPFQPSRRWQQFFIKIKMPHLCFHCLRVTKVTLLRKEGVPREVAMRLVNHSSEMIHMLYDRHQVEDLRQFANAGVRSPNHISSVATKQNHPKR